MTVVTAAQQEQCHPQVTEWWRFSGWSPGVCTGREQKSQKARGELCKF